MDLTPYAPCMEDLPICTIKFAGQKFRHIFQSHGASGYERTHPDFCFQKGDPKIKSYGKSFQTSQCHSILWDHAGFASPGRCLGITIDQTKNGWLGRSMSPDFRRHVLHGWMARPARFPEKEKYIPEKHQEPTHMCQGEVDSNKTHQHFSQAGPLHQL